MTRILFALTLLAACDAPPIEHDLGDPDDVEEIAASATASALRVLRASASADDGNVAAHAIDGRTSTRWSARGVGAYLELELASTSDLDAIGIAWYRGDKRRAAFAVLGSSDGVAFVELARSTSSGRTKSEERLTIAGAARVVRLVGLGNSENDWNSVTELRVYGRARAASGGADAGAAIDAGRVIDAGRDVDAGSVIDAGTVIDAGAPPRAPSDVLDLSRWKLQLPLPDDSPPSPLEIKQPALTGYVHPPYFQLVARGVQFRANAGGATTSGSSYPRSELREMNADGRTNAAWSTSVGVHTLTVRQAITALPRVKPHLVAGQIHDATDDVVMIRLEGRRLFVEVAGDEVALLDDDYALGTSFTFRFEASGGRIRVFYEDLSRPIHDFAAAKTGCYFKAGAYTQSNVSRGDAPTAYGEVIIESVTIDHR